MQSNADLEGNYDIEKDFSKGKAQIKSLADKGNKEAQIMYENIKDMTEKQYEKILNM